MSSSLSTLTTLNVDLGQHAYPIHIGSGLLGRTDLLAPHIAGSLAVIVTNANVESLYGATLRAALAPLNKKITTVVLPDGEAHKHWETLNRIFDHLLQERADRQTTLIALGGGVIGDLTGFAAACYMRGIPFIQVPTTLLAQVDASVGGKTGINHPLGKNMIGAFHHPRVVLADIATLRTLQPRELVAGLAEVIKYGLIDDVDFFDWIENCIDTLLHYDEAALLHAVKTSCEIKARIVTADEREQGMRAILNFGHTFGHAIEAGLGYGVWLHGEAVACGMVMAADLSVRLGLLDPAAQTRIIELIASARLPTHVPALGTARYIELMSIDKKAQAGAIRFVLLNGVGRALIASVSDTALHATLQQRQFTGAHRHAKHL